MPSTVTSAKSIKTPEDFFHILLHPLIYTGPQANKIKSYIYCKVKNSEVKMKLYISCRRIINLTPNCAQICE